jgi:hypothetical protein
VLDPATNAPDAEPDLVLQLKAGIEVESHGLFP